MNSKTSGTGISDCSITNINDLGIWILVEDSEYFIPFSDYPGFKDASVSRIFQVKFHSPSQLHWESLDIDIELDALKKPESFPLVFKP